MSGEPAENITAVEEEGEVDASYQPPPQKTIEYDRILFMKLLLIVFLF